MNFIKAVKNNPKKSVFGAVVLGYAGKWLNNVHENHLYRHATCQTIKHQGLQPMHHLATPKQVTVFLNPAASGGKATKLFRKNSKPVLFLSGSNVKLVKLDHEGQAKQLMAVLEPTDMIVCAGGDGTVNEIVTGIMRRPDSEKWANTPIGIIPLGKTNTICEMLSKGKEGKTQQQWITEATSNLFSGNATMVDVFRVETEDGKDAYGLTDFRWGFYRDAFAKQNNYWFLGSFKKYMTYIWNSKWVKTAEPNELDLSCNEPLKATKEVKEATLGPLNTRQGHNISLSKMLSPLLPSFIKSSESEVEDVKVEEEQEIVKEPEVFDKMEQDIATVEFMASANKHELNERRESYSMHLSLQEKHFNFAEFVQNGPSSMVDGRYVPVNPVKENQCSKFKIVPKNKEDSFFSIDNEAFEAVPCTVELLPNRIKMIHL